MDGGDLVHLFLSTLSLRRATAVPTLQPWHAASFYPRSPCGERHRACQKAKNGITVSIHALLAESDKQVFDVMPTAKAFLSTLSLRRATHMAENWARWIEVSIHALLAESDLLKRSLFARTNCFYPRSPCGERRP